MINFQYNDGGREQAGYKGHVGDCVVRSIAIAAEMDYKTVYDNLRNLMKKGTPRNGVPSKVAKAYLAELGFVWTPTMFIGQGCKIHVKPDELPNGHLVLSLSKHYTAMINGVIHDTYDPSRNGTRCVYGYFIKQ